MAASPLDATAPLRARPLTPADAVQARALLQQECGTNAFLLGWADVNGVGVTTGTGMHMAGAFEAGRLLALLLVLPRQLACVSHGPPRAADALAEYLRHVGGGLRTLLGPRELVRAIIAEPVGLTDAPTVLEQRVYIAAASDVAPHSLSGLREAVEHDIPALVDAGRQMHLEEVGRPLPPERDAAFRKGVSAKVRHARTWVLRDPWSDELLFKASVTATSGDVAQLEGIWTAPHARRRGIAREGVGAVTWQLLSRHAHVALLVGLENTAARELYRTLGFRAAAPYVSVLWDT